MKKRFFKFALPITLGIALSAITLFGLVGCEDLFDTGSSGGGGGSTGCQPKTGCPLNASWLGNNGYCYATSNACLAAQACCSAKCRQCN